MCDAEVLKNLSEYPRESDASVRLRDLDQIK